MFEILNEADAIAIGARFPQAEPDKVDIDILVAGIGGSGILDGCEVTAQGPATMNVDVAVGNVLVAGTLAAVAAGALAIGAADVTNPRLDLIAVDNTGTKSVVVGIAAAVPVFPAIPVNSVILAAILIPAGDTAIETAQIVDKRVAVLAMLYSVHQYVFTPDAAPAAAIVAGDQQGNIYQSGPSQELVKLITSHCKTTPVTTAATWQIEYGDTNDLDTVAVWTEIDLFSHTAAHKTVRSTGFTTATIPADRIIRFNVDAVGGTAAKDVTITLEVWRPLQT